MEPSQPINQQSKKLSPAIISIIVILLIAAAAGTVYAVSKSNESDETNVSTTSNTGTTTGTDTADNSSNSTSSGAYKDGSYSATGNYSTPGGSETITVKVTLSNGTVKDVSSTGSASRGDSKQYQSQFLSNYEDLVVGKSIDSISLSRVAGSSLTSNGFNDAIEQIKTDALS